MKKSFSKQLFNLLVIVLIVKIIEGIQRLVITYKFGISDYSDIYWALISIPDFIIVLTGFNTLNGVVNSHYSGLYAKKDFEKIRESFSNLFGFLFIIAIIVIVLILILNERVVKLLLPGFSDQKHLVTVTFSLIIFPIFFFKSFAVFFSTVLNSYKVFVFPTLMQLLLPLIVLVSVFIPYYRNELIYNLSYSNLIGNIITALIIFLFLLIKVGKVKFSLPKFDDITVTILKGCGVTFLLVISQQFFILSKNFFASFLEDGAISSLYYAGFVTGIISMIIFTSSFNLLLNHLSDLKATEYRARTKNFFMTTVLTIFSVVVPVVIIFLLLNEEIIRIVYMRGNFNTEDVAKTIVPFIWESLSLLNYILYISFTALYLASKKYKALSLIGVPMFLLGILGNFVLSKLFGYFGISISNFIVTLLYALLLIWFSRSFIGSMKKFAVTIIKMLFVSGIVMLIFYIFKESLHLSVNIGAQLYSDLLNTIIYSVLVFSVFNILSYYFRVFYLNSIKVLLWSRYE
ncbi:MAG: hypothetical protein MUE56_07095 [Ignavibacteria bacterium]|nr:hypothetical protein [Ignavibacteria bacterium]